MENNNREVIDYKVFFQIESHREDFKNFTAGVNKLIKEGWEPLGSVSVIATPMNAGVPSSIVHLYQALVKYKAK